MPDEKEKKEKKEETKEEKLSKLKEEIKELKEEKIVKEEVEASPKITFEQFKEFFDSNKELDNSEIYKSFPTVNQGTLRGWKSKAKLLNETPPEEEQEEQTGEETPTPLTKKEIDDLVAEKVKEALKITRKEPSKAKPVSEPVNRATITKNWFEEIV